MHNLNHEAGQKVLPVLKTIQGKAVSCGILLESIYDIIIMFCIDIKMAKTILLCGFATFVQGSGGSGLP
eukprot:4399139-Karenia_brevis.AAC.1